jgi:hypothetical protein
MSDFGSQRYLVSPLGGPLLRAATSSCEAVSMITGPLGTLPVPCQFLFVYAPSEQ